MRQLTGDNDTHEFTDSGQEDTQNVAVVFSGIGWLSRTPLTVLYLDADALLAVGILGWDGARDFPTWLHVLQHRFNARNDLRARQTDSER